MKSLKRLKATLTASFDNLVAEIEDHEAVAEQAIRELKEHLAQNRVRIKSVERELFQSQQKKAQLQESIENWRKRSQMLKPEDGAILEKCARKIVNEKTEIQRLTNRCERLKKESLNLENTHLELQKKLEFFNEKRRELGGRESLAKWESSGLPADELFERWENKIIKSVEKNRPLSGGDFKSHGLEEYFDQMELNTQIEQEIKNLKISK